MSQTLSSPGVSTITSEQITPVHHRGGDLRVTISPRTVNSKHHIMGRVILEPGESVTEHAHDYGEESFYIVSGSGILYSQGEEFPLYAGLSAYTPRGVAHAVSNTATEPLVIVFASSPLAPAPEKGHRDTEGATPIGEVIHQKPSALASCGYVPVADGVELFYRSSGPITCEPVLFLHGNRDNHTHFSELQDLLSQEHRCISIDLRGHGFSTKVDCPLSAELYADDLDAFISYHGWDKVTLVGHSLGAVTSMVYALRRPERVSRVVLMGAAAHYEMKWKRPLVTEETYAQVIQESNKRAGPFFFLEEYPAVQRRVIASWSSIAFVVHRNLIQLTHPDLRERIASIEVPTLIIAGEQDKSTPVESARYLHEQNSWLAASRSAANQPFHVYGKARTGSRTNSAISPCFTRRHSTGQ